MEMNAQAAYAELVIGARERALLASCESLLGWDELTYMPRGGVEYRGNQMAYLAGLQHDKATHARIGDLLDFVEGSPLVADPLMPAAVNVREFRRQFQRLTRLPRSLIEELARVTSFAQAEWVVARQNADFNQFRPWLEKIVALKRYEADALGYAEDPYDALLEEYEPGARTQDLFILFEALQRDLVPLAATLAQTKPKSRLTFLHREFPVDRQRTFAEAVAASLGFDFSRGRLDTTIHPFFSSIGPDDCRIAACYSSHNFSDAFFGILHEVGHALYEQGLDPEHHGTPMGEAVSLGVHEAQSRLWENLVGRSQPFWKHFFPLARQVFHETLHDVTAEQFYRAINQVEPTWNRVQADEITYNLHILIRFQLEHALLAGSLAVSDVPAAWNAGYSQYLGISPGNDREGCLQDGHWSSGLIGYFPTYTLGNLFAAQLFVGAEKDLGNLEDHFARGEFAGLLGWLRDRVYRHGSRFSAPGLIEAATGAPPHHKPFVQALRKKYLALYEIR